jgi:copper resistance protein C
VIRRPTGLARRTSTLVPERTVPAATRPGGAAGPTRRLGAVVVVWLLAVLGAVTGLATPAAAHDALTGSTPEDGATVEAPPASVDLAFTEPPLGIGAEVRVTGPDGQVVNAGDLVVTDTTVSQPIAADLPAGAYAVAWRVTSSDGHPISGELSFTASAGTAAGPEPAPTGEPTSEPTEPSQPTEPSEASGTADPPQESPGPDLADPGAGEDAGGSASALPWVLGGVLLAAAGAAWWAVRRRGTGAAAQG